MMLGKTNLCNGAQAQLQYKDSFGKVNIMDDCNFQKDKFPNTSKERTMVKIWPLEFKKKPSIGKEEQIGNRNQ